MKIKFLRFPDFKTKAVTLSYDDGVEQDIKLVEMMSDYGFKGTFNLNSGCFAKPGTKYSDDTVYDRRLPAKEAISLYKKHNMEIACHSQTHTFLERLPSSLALEEILSDRCCLEKLAKTPVHGLAYPFGTYSDETVAALKAAGIFYARTTASSGRFSVPTDWLRLNPTCHHNDENLSKLISEFKDEDVGADPMLFYLWGHSYEFDADKNWNVIEDFFKSLSDRADTWYATNIDIYNYVRAYESLDFTLDMNYVHNPSALDVYILVKGNHVKIPRGKTVKI